ncbi:MAG: DegQ family serine endoprotease, partial [Gemmatimonadaceae bacterium]
MTRRSISLALSFVLLSGIAFSAAQAAVPPAALPNASGLPSLAPIIKNASPAVVNISTTGVIKRTIQSPFMSPLFQQFFGVQPNQTMEQPFQSLGSGVIVNAQKGYILTNYHVIQDAKTISVTLYDNRTFKAKIIGSDPDTDIAVVQIDAKNLTQLPLGNSTNLQVGDYVVAIGNPFGLEHTATFGIVSALGRPGGASGPGGGAPVGKLDNYIQTDAAINPGNSGGALINLNGQLIGINSAIATNNGGNIGIGFAIPVNMAKAVMEQLIQYGKVDRGVLGVYVQNLTPALAQQFKLPAGQGGALVTQVVKGSAADKAGIQQGDVITEVNGQPVSDPSALASYVAIQHVGTELNLTIYRNGKKMTVSAKTAAAPAGSSAAAAQGGGHQQLGATFGNLDQNSPLYGQVQGVVVTNVQPNGLADQAGLQQGDVIVAVNRRPITNLAQFHEALNSYKGTLLFT